MRLNINLLDYLFVLRPILFFPVWTILLAGYYNAARINSGTIVSGNSSAGGVTIVWVMVLYSMLIGAVFILNQIRDVKTDKENGKLFLIANGHISKKAAAAEAVLLTFFAFLFSLFENLQWGILFLTAFFVTGVLYSLKPFSWKDRPILGLVVNVLGGLLTFSVGWLVAGSIGVHIFFYALPYLLAITAVYFLTTLPDVEGDEAAGKITFGVRYGFRKTTYFAFAAEIAAVTCAIITKDAVIFFPALFALPFFIWAMRTQVLKDVVKATKLAIFFLMIAVCIIFPLYLPLLLFIFLLSRWYYQHRFALSYPSLVAK